MGLNGPGRSGWTLASGRCMKDCCHAHMDGVGRNRGDWRRRSEQVQAGAAALCNEGDAGGDPVLVENVPCIGPALGSSPNKCQGQGSGQGWPWHLFGISSLLENKPTAPYLRTIGKVEGTHHQRQCGYNPQNRGENHKTEEMGVSDSRPSRVDGTPHGSIQLNSPTHFQQVYSQ